MQRYVYIWEFLVEPGKNTEFLSHYGPNGTWVQLFQQAPGYIETILLEDQQSPTRYLTLDRWADSEARDAFLRVHRAEYDRLDRLCQSLTTLEKCLGSYWEMAANTGRKIGDGK